MPLAAVCFLTALAAVSADASRGLAAQLEDMLAAQALSGSHAAVYVRSIDDGKELFSHDADAQLIPASNMKIATTSAALRYLGPDYRFETTLSLVPTAGSLTSGDLVMRGNGDPSLVPERVWYLATRVFYAGVREIGDIVVDDGYFAGPRHANGSEQDRSDSAYMAPTGAVSVGFNALLVHVTPGPVAGAAAKVLVDPASDYAVIEAPITTAARGRAWVNVAVDPDADRSRVRVTGRIPQGDPGRAYWRRVDNPPVFAGEVLKATLQQVGVKVRGRVKVGPTPLDAVRLTTLASPRLADLVSALNKNSNNFMAEQVALALGAARFGAPGTWDKARAAIAGFLEHDVGLAPGTFRIGNGSGLHDVNRMSPRQVVRVLEYMQKNPSFSPEFVASLAVAGSSGTLAERMRATEAAHLLRAKTGTLASASALSGYVTTRGGRTLAFSIIINGYHAPISEVWHVQDQMGALLASLERERHAPEGDRHDVVEVAAP